MNDTNTKMFNEEKMPSAPLKDVDKQVKRLDRKHLTSECTQYLLNEFS